MHVLRLRDERDGRRARRPRRAIAANPRLEGLGGATSRDGRSSRSKPHSGRPPDSARWDDLSFSPESDPLPLELFDELGGKDVDLVVVNATLRPTFDGEKSLTLTYRNPMEKVGWKVLLVHEVGES